jgi:hypothetical protein
MADKTVRYLFLLGALLIAGAYFVGLSTDIGALSQGVVAVGRTFTGQNAAGTGFLQYPTTPAAPA